MIDRIFERKFWSAKAYGDPFNEVSVDVIFERGGKSWRVPAYWSGDQAWTVRFAPPGSGTYDYRLETTDPDNESLNRASGQADIRYKEGGVDLLGRGALRVSSDGRYLEHADGTPFFWLADTWWTGLSDRLSWDGFRAVAADRKAKGFTAIQLVAGLVPNEELVPVDPGCHNEGGPVWTQDFGQINPRYFDFADRRILHLVELDLMPVIVGAWGNVLAQTGVERMKAHWRYIVARYSALPVVWVVGGELLDPPDHVVERLTPAHRKFVTPGWTAVARYIKEIDPHRRLLTAHEIAPPVLDFPLRDESLTDFDFIQSSHFLGWSLRASIAQLNRHYARTSVRKPVIQGEIGYEQLGGLHLEDYQRIAFWISMLNGGAGHSYGADGLWEAYTADKPLHRQRWSFLTWEEGMALPGAEQVALNAAFVRRFRWWHFEPRPDWVVPRAPTLLEPHPQINDLDLKLEPRPTPESKIPETVQLPFAAGIPGESRIIYVPSAGIFPPTPPTVLGLERGVRYRAAMWQPSLGIEFDLGTISCPPDGPVIYESSGDALDRALVDPIDLSGQCEGAHLFGLRLVPQLHELDLRCTVTLSRAETIAIFLRFLNKANFVAVVFDPAARTLAIVERCEGDDLPVQGQIQLDDLPEAGLRLVIELRGGKAIARLEAGDVSFTSPIVNVVSRGEGRVGISSTTGEASSVGIEVRQLCELPAPEPTNRKVYDARGRLRGELHGEGHPIYTHYHGWENFGTDAHLLLDAYRPERFPASSDWVIFLSAMREDG